MQCPACTVSNPAQARFCLNCGNLLVSGHVCTGCHTLLPPDARYCFHCGGMVVATANSCKSCGAQMIAGQHYCANCGATTGWAGTLPPPRIVDPIISFAQPHVVRAQTASPAGHAMTTVITDATAPPSEARPLSDLLPSLKSYLPGVLYEPLERRPTEHDINKVRDHLLALLRSTRTYLPKAVVVSPQPPGVPAGGMEEGTFLFVDVTGFTALSERLMKLGRAGAERVTEIMNNLFFDLVGILYDHEGSLLKFGGDAILGVFASDEGDAAFRALRAAVAMQSVMGKFANIEAVGTTSALRIKVGLSTGRYFAAHIGTPHNMGYVTTGTTVNRVEHCEDHAEPGEVVLDQFTYEMVKERAEFTLVEEGFHRLTDYSGAVDTELGTISLVPLDDDPPGDVMMQIKYLTDRMDRLTPYLAADLLPRLVTHPTDVQIAPEHRPVSVMFVNYMGIADLIQDMGDTRADLITQQLNSYFVHMANVVEKYEGTLARMDHYSVGDRLVIFFGAPRAHEDDPLRAVYTALEMQAATRKNFAALQTPQGIYRFRQRIGINSGYLFAGNVGAASLRQEYTLMGDDINMAARLMSKSDWDEIFVSKRTQERVSAYITLEDKGEIKVKGKEIPVPTFKVLSRRAEVGQTRGLASGESPLTGRDDDLAKVLKVGDTLLSGRGQILSVIAGSGRGKSRLMREFKKALLAREDAPNLRILEGQALSFSEQISYWLIAQVLYGVLGLPPDANTSDVLFKLWDEGEQLLGEETAREVIPFLAFLLDIPLEGDWANWVGELDPKARQKQTFWATREFFCALAREQPMLIILDDLHWADEASLAMIEDLLSVTDRSALMFYLIFREVRDKGVWRLRDKANSIYAHRYTQIELQPLTSTQSIDLLVRLLPGAEFADSTKQEILAKAAGNPFYLEEVVRTLIESGALIPDPDQEGSWQITSAINTIAVPDTLQSAIVSRIDRLTEDARQALQMAAVIGRRFRVEVFSCLTGAAAEMEIWLSQLERTGMITPAELTPETDYDFPDALVQEVAYDSLLVQRREEFHRRVGEALEALFSDESEQNAEVLAYHFSRSDATERAIKYLDLAGEKAQREFANETALRHYKALLSLLGEDEGRWDKRFEVLNQRQQVYGLLGRQPEREADLQAMLSLAGAHSDTPRRADALCGLADLYQWTSRYDETITAAREALEIKETVGDKTGQAAALHHIGVVNYYRGNYPPAREALERAAALRHEVNDPAGESWSQLYLTMINFVSGNYSEASIYNDRALRAAESRQDWMLMGIHLNNGARIAHRLGEYDIALANLQQSLEMRSRVGDRTGMGFTLYSIGLVYTYQSIYDKAEAAFRESMKIREAINDERGMSYCLHGLGLVYLGRGVMDQAETYFLPAKEMEERLNLKGELIGTVSYIGQLYLRMDRHEDALVFSQQAIDMLAEQKNVEEVQQIYLNHYRVLTASADATADEYLQKSRDAMMQQAEAIDDLEKRETFLKKVKVNQEITAALAEPQ